jgi:uncharacterized protein
MPKYVYTDTSKARTNLAIIFVMALALGFLIGSYYTNPEIKVFPASYISQASINLPAVDENGKGIATPLKVEVRAGDGKVLTNIDKLLFWVDTQFSIQTAKDVAAKYTKIDIGKFDLIYAIGGENETTVGGPSAGAALTIATIAALENKTLKPNIMITGTIEPDGAIGQVGGILEKAQAAKSVGATTLLVPVGESSYTYFEPQQSCSQIGGFTYCETKYKEISLNVEQESGIRVIEVANINQAVSYFL